MSNQKNKIHIALYIDTNASSDVQITNKIVSDLEDLSEKKIFFHFFMPYKINFNFPKEYKIIIHPKLNYYFKTADCRMYSIFLSYLINNKIDKAYICRTQFPEFFLNDLNYLKKLKTKIFLLFTAYELAHKWNLARSETVIKLIKHPLLCKSLIISCLGRESYGPQYFEKKLIKCKDKFVKIADPIFLQRKKKFNLKSKTFCRKKLRIPAKDFIVLYYGRPFFGKGFDIFLDTIKNCNKKIKFLIVTYLKDINFTLSSNQKKMLYSKKVILINRYIKNSEISTILGAADIVCCPYKKSYTYGTSAVLLEALLAERPAIVPDFTPFNDFVNKYKFGLVYKAENLNSLKSTINKSIVFVKKKENLHVTKEKYLQFYNEHKSIAYYILNN